LGDRCDYYNKDRGWRNIDNGIIGDVILQSVPNITIEDIFIKTNVKESLLEADFTVFNPTDKLVKFNVGAYISEYDNHKKVLKIEDSKIISLRPKEKRSIAFSQTWNNPELWWPHSPHLYYFNTTISQGGKIVGMQRERFGFRQVEVVASENDSIRGFYLNGIRVRLFGESMEPTWKDGYSEGVSGAMYLYNPEYWAYSIDVCKELNINTLRTHRGMSLKRQFEIADEKGMMMIAESTINNGNHKGGSGTLENQQKAIRDMIKNYRNHPSIIFWSLANETPYNKEWEVEALLHDSTRPLTATQLTPTNYPSENISTAACAYSMGLNGYSSEIYNRHDTNWTDKLLYVYEDNAHYDEPLDADRSTSVQKGLSIFRGHRTTGYEMIFTFYTWQKLFGQPKTEDKKLLKINWSEDQKQSCGYHPDYALMPLLDPWTDRENPQIINPLSDIQQATMDFWKRTFSPVAVFDYEYDKRTNINSEIMPYVAKLEKQRLLTIHNDDLIDTTTAIEIRWKVLDFVKDSTISQGSFITNVLLGGVKQQKVSLKWANNNKVRVNYTCYKSGKERFSETIYLSDDIKQKKFTSAQEVKMTSDTLIIKATSYGVGNKGFESAKISNSFSSNVLLNDHPTTGDYVQFNPWITEDASYFLYLHIPQGFKGIQKVAIQHDTHNTEVSIDLSKSGWLKLIDEPLLMKSGELENNIKIHVTNDSQKVVADALKIIKYH
ncbi:hypothetical protein KAJ27_25435, partial [bacterium]|nr:hypothetical protein [bacterium]